ncbi:MAG: peptidase M64 [Candidatus Marinimicrobia bacterium]|nr:peptidase M64 [Candidatus Neomarinimicrobiota bacterium]
MKKISILLIFISTVLADVQFDEYFLPKTLRIDFYQTGDARHTIISLDQIKEELIWAGSRVNLIDDLDLGEHVAKVFDAATGELLFSKGFNSIFAEYVTTQPAFDGICKSYHNTVLVPYPKNTVRFTLSTKNRENLLVQEFETLIDPDSRFINRDKNKYNYRVKSYLNNGDPTKKVDILVLPEGYTKKEMKKFRKDIEKGMKEFFNTEPFKSQKDQFNVFYIETPSQESGVDDPRAGKFYDTFYDLTYNTLDIDRYVQGCNNQVMRDVAALAPYDQVYFIMNSDKYGGGGIYNFCSICYSPSQQKDPEWWPLYAFVHEFGHSFAGLADEYYSSEVAYNDMYPVDVEPWELNITTTTDRKKIKWKDLMGPDTEVPTDWGKGEYEAIPYSDSQARYDFLRNHKNWGKVGVFEGAGYASQGVYRPYMDCRMFSKSLSPFCPVCEAGLQKVIDFYTK